MDYLTKEEVKKLKADKEATGEMLDAEKYMFQRKLNGEMGKQMMAELENPRKISFWEGVRNRIRRRRMMRRDRKIAKRLLKMDVDHP